MHNEGLICKFKNIASKPWEIWIIQIKISVLPKCICHVVIKVDRIAHFKNRCQSVNTSNVFQRKD